MTYRDKMSRGLDFLDANVPNWFERIDTMTLDMRSCGSCVLGQLFPNEDGFFGDSVVDLLESEYDYETQYIYEWARERGFDAAGDEWPANVDGLWIDEIVARQEGLIER